MVYRTTSWLLVSSFVFIWLPDLDFGLLIDQLARHEDDAHAPSGMSREKPSELLKRQFLIIDMHSDLPVGAAVIDMAAKQVAARRPLVTKVQILDLRPAGLNLDDDVLPFRHELIPYIHHVVEHVEDGLIRCLLDVRADAKMRRRDRRIRERNDRLLPAARDPDFVRRRPSGLLDAHEHVS